MIKKLFITLILLFLATSAVAQYCACISVTNNKEGREIKSGTTKSSDSYILLIQKEINHSNMSNEPTYYLSLDATSRAAFSNSLVKDKGKIELLLKDKSKLILEKARCLYNPVASGFAITFGATITKEQLENLLLNPIVTFSAFDILKTSFKEKKQIEQQIIISCLLND